MLRSMQNDHWTIEHCPTVKEIWKRLNIIYGGTYMTGFRTVTLKFETYMMDPKHIMAEHLKSYHPWFVIWSRLVIISVTTNRINATIRPLPDSWEALKLVLMHNENIKMFDDISRHLELEAECHRESQCPHYRPFKTTQAYAAKPWKTVEC